MCTVIILRNIVQGYPLVIASNREEAYDRETTKPTVLSRSKDNPVVGAKDKVKGGTWLAFAPKSNLVVTVVNENDSFDDSLESRGNLVLDGIKKTVTALDFKNKVMKKLDCSKYNSFNLIAADDENTYICFGQGQKKAIIHKLPGKVSVITNNHFSFKSHIKETFIKNQVSKVLEAVHKCNDITVIRDYLMLVLGNHKGPKVEKDFKSSMCIHDEDYGTKSSSIIAIPSQDWGRQPREREYWYANGHPCTSELSSYKKLVKV